VYTFEKNVVQLLESHGIDFEFNAVDHYLKSALLNIDFMPGGVVKAFSNENSTAEIKPLTIRLWEDLYINHPVVINSRILSLLGISSRIYARKTTVSSISQEVLDVFVAENHLNIPLRAKYRYGLYHLQKLVAIMAFGRSCPIQVSGTTYKSYELLRYCSMVNCTVVGGLSKLIHHFEEKINPEHIMTYVDREWSEGKSYINLGFTIDTFTSPYGFWLSPENNERINEKSLPNNFTANELRDKGWRFIKNLGNVKLVKYQK